MKHTYEVMSLVCFIDHKLTLREDAKENIFAEFKETAKGLSARTFAKSASSLV